MTPLYRPIVLFLLCGWFLLPAHFAAAAELKLAWSFSKQSLNLLVNGKKFPVVSKGVSSYQQLLPAEFSGYAIPKDALLAAYSWQAGYGDVVYVVKKTGRLEIFRREMDESETSRLPVEKVVTIQLE